MKEIKSGINTERVVIDSVKMKEIFMKMTVEVEKQLKEADKKNTGSLVAAESFIANI